MASESTIVRCITCGRTGPLPEQYADTWDGECPACKRDRADAAAIGRHAECNIALDRSIDAGELMRLADDGAPAADVVDSWTDTDFPTHTAASMDDAPAETGAGSHVEEAGSRNGHGRRDADRDSFLHGAGNPDEPTDASASQSATMATRGEPMNATVTRSERVGVDSSQAGAGSTPAPALSSSARAGAATHAAPAHRGDFILASGDMTARFACQRAIVTSDNLTSVANTAILRLRNRLFGRLAGRESA